MKRKTGTISALFLSLAGCATYNQGTLPIKTNRNYGLFAQLGIYKEFTVYTDIDEDTVEKQLINQAQESEYEEAWIYLPKKRKLIEIGQCETQGRVELAIPDDILDEETHAVKYHIHPFRTHAGGLYERLFNSDPKKVKELEDYLNKKFVFAIPSAADVKSCLFFGREFKEKKKCTLESRIVDYQGIMHYKAAEPLPSEEYEKIRDLNFKYWLSQIDYKTLCNEHEKLGVTLDYRKKAGLKVTIGLKTNASRQSPEEHQK